LAGKISTQTRDKNDAARHGRERTGGTPKFEGRERLSELGTKEPLFSSI
jgi:hypothetical protein